ncbi:N-acetylgalactosamine-6-sulfatase, partial [Xanthomonas citri pv. citri]|nr:N-acetylgalactosamine-6-sulfatase [Xanthomonas citri pv. citri]
MLTDDQDSVLLGASRMPQTRQLLASKGAVFSNAFVSSPLCCPSRA